MFKFGTVSLRNLIGVHPDLVAVATRALKLSKIDFRVIEGIRSPARQKLLVAAGASQTLNSRHITGHAIDITPIVAGKVRWDWPLFYPLATAMKLAAEELGVDVRWGGCWKSLSEIEDPEEAVAAYVAERRSQGRKAFLDGPHFELGKDYK